MIEEFVPTWSLAPVIRALQTLRGVDLIVAVTFATEVGDVSRFESPRQLMGYLGLVPICGHHPPLPVDQAKLR